MGRPGSANGPVGGPKPVKYIHKGGRPRAYAEWCDKVVGTDQEDYRDLPGVTKQALLKALIQEQGALCAYTMRRIEEGSSHVEHIKPQSLCRTECRGADLDYGNLVACFPREDMMKLFRWGAQRKGNWWGEGAFVSPLHPACERRFHFDLDGNIATAGNDAAARTTVQVLGLDHPGLTEERGRVIQEYLFGPNGDDPMSRAQATRAEEVVCNRDGRGIFIEYCVAIRYALRQHLALLDRRARKKKALRRRS
jgi:uncharacterized protein (TIGR02646 family)